MARPINGLGGSGDPTVYELRPTEVFVLDTLTFKLTTGLVTGRRTPEVRLLTPDGSLLAGIPDWNDLFESMVVTYTFGRGLTPFCGTINSGGKVQNDLPFTVLEGSCQVVLASVDDTGQVLVDDAFSDVLLWVEDTDASTAGGGGGGASDPAAWWLYASAGQT